MKKAYWFILLILPAVLIFTAAILRYSQGPYWITYNSLDPEYLYIISSLALADGKKMGTTGNPGTTLQILGATVLKITHALDFTEKDTLEFAVLKNPEFYLTIINIILITLNVVMLFVIGGVTWLLTKNIWLGLLLQLSPFLSNIVLTQGLSRVSPEPLLLFTTLLFVLILVKIVLDKNFFNKAHWYMIALAVVSGFGLATKLTFGPLLIIPFFVLPRLRNKIGFLLLTGVSFVFFTWPLISQYELLFDWYYRIITHTGYYGEGYPGFADTRTYVYNLQTLLFKHPLLLMIWALTFCFFLRLIILFSGAKEGAKNIWHNISYRILFLVLVAQMIVFLAVAKSNHERYLVPIMSLSGFMLFLLFMNLKQHDKKRFLQTKTAFLVIAIFFMAGCMWRTYDIKNVIMLNLFIKKDALWVWHKAESEYKNRLIVYRFYFSSSPINALALGNYFINEGLYSESLQKIYGESYFYGLNGKFHTWTKVFSIEDLILKDNDHKIVFLFPTEFGNILKCSTGSVLHLRDVLGGAYQTIYSPEGILLSNEKKIRSTNSNSFTPPFNFYGSVFQYPHNYNLEFQKRN